MVVRLLTGKNIAGALQYNEQKVLSGQAQRLYIGNYPDPETTNWSWLAKREMLEFLASKNPRVEKPTVHISLAFHPDEQLSDKQLRQITGQFLASAGYGKQPYILYQHQDTAHPHVHIVTVCVDRNGRKISDTFIRNRLNAIRKDIEIQFGLVQAEGQQPAQNIPIITGIGEPFGGRISQEQTKAALDATIQHVLNEYNCTSFADLSRLLDRFHIQVRTLIRNVQGRESTGVVFRLTDGDKAVSPAIKASKLIGKPTFNRLKAIFEQGQIKKEQLRPAFLNRLQRELTAFSSLTESDFYATLRAVGVQVIDDGQTYLYLDTHTKTLWNEVELGKPYSKVALQKEFSTHTERLSIQISPEEGQSLGRQVARQYAIYREQTGSNFESQVIEAFPFTQLVRQLRAEGVATDRAITAVRQFEQYKQGQLTLMRAREGAEFRRSATNYVELASQLTLSPSGRLAFLRAVDITLLEGVVTHRHNPQLKLPLIASQQENLMTSSYGHRVVFGKNFPVGEKRLYEWLAVGERLTGGHFDSVNMNRLQKMLPSDLWSQVGKQYNEYQAGLLTQQMSGNKEWATVEQFYRQGILIQPDGSTFRVGHYKTDPATHVDLSEETVNQLRLLGYGEHQFRTYQAGLETPLGRQMIQLANALAVGNQGRVDGARRLIYFANQKSIPFFADDMTLLLDLTRRSQENVNQKSLSNDLKDQPIRALTDRPDNNGIRFQSMAGLTETTIGENDRHLRGIRRN
ncbi:relaxase/mobilization nuclease domain-containing protein [Spirosoma sordidisoli]|uniref:MobA/VirD2-like nuclease domain-containing protein n=1 Tax=Spirosoma sordidisoli TaxID=2502893 RepID=A0A4Q2UGV5_9BACT|nr:relaxase/mobilization nuclease domain-containing protein [Spirosoma sordidisoli]RYC66510.1 hypothetical protein EQG79_29505 [Spirosoma sordidisoli]